jgi:hypothetical protein
MTEYLKKMIERSSVDPPAACIEAFNMAFNGAVNPEWHLIRGLFESVFYQDNLEHIAVFDDAGKLLEHKMFLPQELLPEQIRSDLLKRGEIMNAVLINKGHHIEYEAIVRVNTLERHQITCSQLGKILKEKKL